MAISLRPPPPFILSSSKDIPSPLGRGLGVRGVLTPEILSIPSIHVEFGSPSPLMGEGLG